MGRETDTVLFAKALADETRQRIMALCCCNPVSVGELAELMDVTQPTVSHHLGILRNARLVIVRRRGRQVLYQVDQQRLAQHCCRVAEVFAPEYPVEASDE
jgi:DNA-binding transcriptional ArsR family regulator